MPHTKPEIINDLMTEVWKKYGPSGGENFNSYIDARDLTEMIYDHITDSTAIPKLTAEIKNLQDEIERLEYQISEMRDQGMDDGTEEAQFRDLTG